MARLALPRGFCGRAAKSVSSRPQKTSLPAHEMAMNQSNLGRSQEGDATQASPQAKHKAPFGPREECAKVVPGNCPRWIPNVRYCSLVVGRMGKEYKCRRALTRIKH